MVSSKWGSPPPGSIDCAGILKLRNADIELRKGETDIGRKNTRVRLVFRVHIPESSGRIVSLQTASNPIECCKLGFGQGRPLQSVLYVTVHPGQGAQQEYPRPTRVHRGPKRTIGPRDRAHVTISLCFCLLVEGSVVSQEIKKIIQLMSSLQLCLEDLKCINDLVLKKVDAVGVSSLYTASSFSFPGLSFQSEGSPSGSRLLSGDAAGHSAEHSALDSSWNLHSSLWQWLVP